MHLLPGNILKKGLENPQWEWQTVDWFDGQCTAFSREAFFSGNVLPYTDRYDAQSWWTSGLVLILKANHHYRNRIVQCNQLKVTNTQYAQYPRGFEIFGEAYCWTLDQLGVDTIEMSTGNEIKLHVDFPRTPLWHLRCCGVKTIRRLRRFGSPVKSRIKRLLQTVTLSRG